MTSRIAIWLVLVAAGIPCAVAGSLVKVWELDLTRWNGGSADNFPVVALVYSPDGKRLAFTATNTLMKAGTGEAGASRLLVASIGGDATRVATFAISGGGGHLDWSPAGDSVLINGVLIRLDTGALCRIPGGFGFLAANQVIGRSRGKSPGSATVFTVFDNACRPGKHWASPEQLNIDDISLDRHLILVSTGRAENLLLTESGDVIRRWSGPSGLFADSGKALCGVAGEAVEDAPDGTNVSCRSTDTGELIGYGPARRASLPIAVSLQSPRVIFSELGSLPLLGLLPGVNPHPYLGAVVWDFRTGERLASWRPDIQTYSLRQPPVRIREASKFAISPDGSSVAEAGNGRLVVFHVVK